MNIYAGQSSLRVSARTGTALSDVAVCEIRFEKPDGSRGAWTAFVSNAERGIVSYDVVDGDLDQAGWWRFWVFVTFTDERSAFGDAARIYVREEGR